MSDLKCEIKDMTVDQLVERFAEIGIAQDKALLYSQVANFNRLYRQMNTVDIELQSRGRAARLALSCLYTHSNMQVRLQAAKFSLAVAPSAARDVIEAISVSRHYPQAGDAGMTIANLDDGIFKPK